ncbi:hypothetical protein ACIBG7_43075 [Nonomuraea sp. NPDC050328]|uniref:hypothetical protein n=1 Tax=Nonomuraea sp. NPDC050328 TaxID=3364361 RepID=UPI00379EE940
MAERWFELGTAALHAAMRTPHDLTAAVGHVQALIDECEPDGLVRAILAWSDTLIDRSGMFADGSLIQLMWLPEGADAAVFADDVEPLTRWSGRLLVARALDDQATWEALMDSVPDDPRVRGDHVLALLRIVALNLLQIQLGTHPGVRT